MAASQRLREGLIRFQDTIQEICQSEEGINGDHMDVIRNAMSTAKEAINLIERDEQYEKDNDIDGEWKILDKDKIVLDEGNDEVE